MDHIAELSLIFILQMEVSDQHELRWQIGKLKMLLGKMIFRREEICPPTVLVISDTNIVEGNLSNCTRGE